MESIKEFKRNKIRPGTTFVPGFTLPGNNDDLRSIDVNGNEMRFTPNSRYYASCKIKRGQAVSIAMLEDLAESQRNNKFAYVKITDPDIDETCLGIAVNSAEEGEIVTIQNKGKFNYYSTASVLNTESRRNEELFLDTDLWSFDNVRGQRLYIKKLYNNTTGAYETTDKIRDQFKDERGDSFDTGHDDYSKDQHFSEGFTYDFLDSVFNVKNTIQIGYLTDAPFCNRYFYQEVSKTKDGKEYTSYQGVKKTELGLVPVDDYKEGILVKANSDGSIVVSKDCNVLDSFGFVRTYKAGDPAPKPNEVNWVQVNSSDSALFEFVDDLVVTLELEVTGDTRGAIDNTQFLITLGESIYFHPKKQDVELKSMDLNEGVFDEVKLLSISKGEKTSPTFRFFFRSNVPENLGQGFIGVRKLDGNTCIIPVCSPELTMEEMCGGLISAQDEGYWKLSCAFTTFDQRREIAGEDVENPKIEVLDNITNPTKDTLKIAISRALEFVYIEDETGNTECHVKTRDIGSQGFEISLEEQQGFFDVYLSESLLPYLTFETVSNGNSAPAGTAVLADIRDSSRCQVVGVVLSNAEGVRHKGERVKVMKMGRLVTNGNVQKGKQYYLGLNGRITAREQYWYDCNIPVAIAETENYLIFDVEQRPLRDYNGSYPLGYVKPSIRGMNEEGFLLADGITQYSKFEYPELYEALLQWYSPEELDPKNITPEEAEKFNNNKVISLFEDLYKDYASNKNAIYDLQNTVAEIIAKNTEQDEALEEIKSLNAEQDRTLEEIKNVNIEQDLSIADLKEADNTLKGLIDGLTSENEKRIKEISGVNEELAATNKNLADLEATMKKDFATKAELADEVKGLKDLIDTKIADVNTELVKINTTLGEHNQKLQDLSTTLSTQDQRMSALDSKLDSHIEDFETFKTQNAQDITNQISAAKADLENQIGSTKSDLENQIVVVRNDLSTALETINKLKTLVWKEGESFSGDVIDLLTRYNDERAQQVSTVDAALRQIISDNKTSLEDQIKDLSDKNTELETAISTLESTVATQKEAVEERLDSLEEVSKTFSTKEELEKIATFNDAGELSGGVLSEEVAALQADLEAKKSKITTLENSLNAVTEQLDDLLNLMAEWNGDYAKVTFDTSSYLTTVLNEAAIDLSSYKKLTLKGTQTTLADLLSSVDPNIFQLGEEQKAELYCRIGNDVYSYTTPFDVPENGQLVLDYGTRTESRFTKVTVTPPPAWEALESIDTEIASGTKLVKETEWDNTVTESYWQLLQTVLSAKPTSGWNLPDEDTLLNNYLFNGSLVTSEVSLGWEDLTIAITERPQIIMTPSVSSSTEFNDSLREVASDADSYPERTLIALKDFTLTSGENTATLAKSRLFRLEEILEEETVEDSVEGTDLDEGTTSDEPAEESSTTSENDSNSEAEKTDTDPSIIKNSQTGDKVTVDGTDYFVIDNTLPKETVKKVVGFKVKTLDDSSETDLMFPITFNYSAPAPVES